MGRKAGLEDHDRYLLRRGDIYHYKRYVPAEVADLDSRAPLIRQSLKTSDLQKAMALRDIHERADNEFWASLVVGSDQDVAMRRYKAAVARAAALGFTYRSAADIAALEPTGVILERVEKAVSEPELAKPALLGLVDGAEKTIRKAIEFYFEEIVPDQLRTKSEDQKRRWKNKRRSSVETFVSICSDKAMSEITREDAQKVHSHWMKKIAPAKGPASHSPSTGNRDMGNLRTFYDGWFKYFGATEIKNPFDGLSFSDKRSSKRKRPPFSVEWITGTLLKPGALNGMNSEARGVFLTLIETGARLSEICNLRPDQIVLDGDVPHIRIEPSEDPDDPREIKTDSSVRIVPLAGVSLAAMKANPHGFPRYKDKGVHLSNTIQKFLRTNELLESKKHTTYSLRHSFEDRMKDAGLDTELRMMLMGHSIDRPDYGSGGSLKWKHDELLKIALPFDPSVV